MNDRRTYTCRGRHARARTIWQIVTRAPRRGMHDIARQLGWSTASVHRAMHDLIDRGYISQPARGVRIVHLPFIAIEPHDDTGGD